MGTDKPRYSITVDDDMFQQIEDYRYSNRFPNRNVATIELIRLGLESLKIKQQENHSETTEKSIRELLNIPSKVAAQSGGIVNIEESYNKSKKNVE